MKRKIEKRGDKYIVRTVNEFTEAEFLKELENLYILVRNFETQKQVQEKNIVEMKKAIEKLDENIRATNDLINEMSRYVSKKQLKEIARLVDKKLNR